MGTLTRMFPPELVDEVIEVTGTREVRRRLLPARLVMYFVLALWLFRGRNCGYGQVMSKLVESLYHRRQGEQLLAGLAVEPGGDVADGAGRRWRLPNISNLARARAKLGADPVRMLFEEVAGPVAGPDTPGVWMLGLRVISMDGATVDVPDTPENRASFSGPGNDKRDGAFPQVRMVVAAESGTGALTGAAFGPYTTGEQTLALDLLSGFGPDMVVLAGHRLPVPQARS